MEKSDNIKYYSSLDVLKFILAILVVLRHCCQTFYDSNSTFYWVITNGISPIAVPTFFIISSFLFYRGSTQWRNFWLWMKRILKLYLIWSIIYLPLEINYDYTNSNFYLLEYLWFYFKKSLFDGTFYHLWYLPSLVVAMAIIYCTKKKIKDIWIMIILTIFWLFGLYVNTYYYPVEGLDQIIHKYKQVFITTRNGLFFGAIFVYFGSLIAKYERKLKEIKKQSICIALCLSFVLLVLETIFIFHRGSTNIVNMNFSAIFISMLLVVLAIRINDNITFSVKGIRYIGTMIYLSHPLIITIITKMTDFTGFINSIFRIACVIILCCIFSYVCYRLSSKKEIFKIFV